MCLLSNSLIMKCPVIRALCSVYRTKISITMFCGFEMFLLLLEHKVSSWLRPLCGSVKDKPKWLKGEWNQVDKYWQDPWLIPIFGIPAPLVARGEEGRQSVCTALAQRAPEHAAHLHSAITAYSTSLKGHSVVSHFVTNNNYLSNSLWWELALRRLLWLQEVQQDAPNDALCYFGHALLAPRESARGKNLVHLTIRTFLEWYRSL